MAGVITPVLVTTGVAFANHWYNTGALDLKIPVAGAIAAAIGSGISQIPGLGPVVTSIAWIAFVSVLIAPVQKPSPVDNLLKITGGL
jgi:hypothetical protein